MTLSVSDALRLSREVIKNQNDYTQLVTQIGAFNQASATLITSVFESDGRPTHAALTPKLKNKMTVALEDFHKSECGSQPNDNPVTVLKSQCSQSVKHEFDWSKVGLREDSTFEVSHMLKGPPEKVCDEMCEHFSLNSCERADVKEAFLRQDAAFGLNRLLKEIINQKSCTLKEFIPFIDKIYMVEFELLGKKIYDQEQKTTQLREADARRKSAERQEQRIRSKQAVDYVSQKKPTATKVATNGVPTLEEPDLSSISDYMRSAFISKLEENNITFQQLKDKAIGAINQQTFELLAEPFCKWQLYLSCFGLSQDVFTDCNTKQHREGTKEAAKYCLSKIPKHTNLFELFTKIVSNTNNATIIGEAIKILKQNREL